MIIRSEVARSLRFLRTSPRYALVAIVTIAFGIGACTAVFSVLNSLQFRDRPGIVDPERLVDVGRTQNGSGFDNFSYPDFVDYRAQNSSFVDLAATEFAPHPVGLSANGDAQSAYAQWVSANYFQVLGTKMALGRDFSAGNGTEPDVILSYRYWSRRFNADSAVLGRTLLLNGHAVTVTGVAAAGFNGATVLAPDLWMPISLIPLLDPTSQLLTNREDVFIGAIGRLKAGVTRAAAQAEMSAIAQRLEKIYPNSNHGRGVVLRPSSRLPGEINDIASLFLGVLGLLTGLTMLVACTNIAGLTIARGAIRQREFAVRLAIGASRTDLGRQIVAEQLLLFILGGIGGAFLCSWLLRLLEAVWPHLPVPLFLDLRMNATDFLFAAGFALLAGLLSSLLPAIQSSRFDLLPALRRDDPADRPGFTLRKLFLGAQLTFSLAMLVTAASLGWSVVALSRLDPQFDSTHLEFAQFDLATAGMKAEHGRAFVGQLLQCVQALPNVEAAACASGIPLENSGRSYGALRLPTAKEGPEIDWDLVTPGYFYSLGIPIQRGRNFNPHDGAGAPRVAIVNETLAQRLWPNQNPVGQILLNQENKPIEIIGVARNAKYRTISESPRLHLYAPLAQLDESRLSLLVKSRDGGSVLPQVRQLIRQLAPALPISHSDSLAGSIAAYLLPQRIAAAVACAAGFLALILGIMGVYGITLYTVSTRRREFGIRHALGATIANLLSLSLRTSLRLAMVALPLGLLGAFALARLVASVFGDAVQINLWIFTGSGVLFLGVVALAALLPAQAAARVDPMVALRTE